MVWVLAAHVLKRAQLFAVFAMHLWLCPFYDSTSKHRQPKYRVAQYRGQNIAHKNIARRKYRQNKTSPPKHRRRNIATEISPRKFCKNDKLNLTCLT